jgi:hypothetical protein
MHAATPRMYFLNIDLTWSISNWSTPVNSIYLPGTITFSHLAVKKWSFAWATREQWRQPSTPFPRARHIVRQFQSLYTPSPRGPIATPYSTSVSVPLYAITARSITNHARQVALALASHFSRKLSFQIKDMEFTDQHWTQARVYVSVAMATR